MAQKEEVWVVELQRLRKYERLSYEELIAESKNHEIDDVDYCEPYQNQIVGLYKDHEDASKACREAYEYCGFGYIPQMYQMDLN